MQPPLPAPPPGPGPVDDVLHDADWAGEARSALACAGSLLGVSLGVDACAREPTLLGTVGWIALATLLLVVLLPARVGAAPDLLVVRGLWLTRTVRIDRLTSVSWPEGTSRRLVLRDDEGSRAEVDLRVLLANPALWLRIEAGAHASRRRGFLTRGTADLARLSVHVHAETTRSVLKVSGLE
ncbi:hypothetical protein ACIPQA_31230 [Streptomyces sp. NPDC090109]|uniref:hypothetical protein n=1 Tax=unclassified Streptomyces TaxID=2593676 RepID=UPI00136B29C6|nr:MULTISPECIES: hypothetical protein [unclassified Streptomyces]MZE51762.1 hypothetical protein [Streptomyces sp. SID5770]